MLANAAESPIVSGNELDASAFLTSLRSILLDPDTGTPLIGRVRKAHQPVIDQYCEEAGAVADLQIQEAVSAVPILGEPDFNALRVAYRKDYVVLTGRMGLVSLRLADRDVPQFADVLEKPDRRFAVMGALGRDFKRSALYMCGKDLSKLSRAHFLTNFPLYHGPEEVKAIATDQKYASFGISAIHLSLRSYYKHPRAFLDDTIEKAEELAKNPAYAELGPNAIKTAAASHRDPEAFLEAVLKRTAELVANPAYAVFSLGNLRLVALTRADPEGFLDTAIAERSRLLRQTGYQRFGVWTIDTAVLKHPGNARQFLDTAIEKYDQLCSDPRYSGRIVPHVIKIAVVIYTPDPESYLDDILSGARPAPK